MNSKNKKGLTQSQLNLVSALNSLLAHQPNDVFKLDGGPTNPKKRDTYMTNNVKQMSSSDRAIINNSRLTVSYPTVSFEKQGSGKSKSRDRYREKAGGGMSNDVMNQQLADNNQMTGMLSSAVSMIPGVGGILGGITSMLGKSFGNDIADKFNTKPLKSETNIYGNLKLGGYVNKNFIQYNTGSHDSGNDLPIDSNGNASGKATGGYVQNKENAYKFGDNSYVMSDTLINPETGNLFNIDAAKLNSKYKNADKLPEEQNAMDFGMKRLSVINDSMRNIKEQVLKACGGSTKKTMEGGGDPVRNRPWVDAYGNVNQPDNQQIEPLAPINAEVPLATDPFAGTQVNSENYLNANPIPDNTNILGNSEINLGTNLTPMEYRSPTTDNPGLLESASTSTTKTEPGGFNYNWLAAGLKGVALGKSIADALTPAEKERPILPNYGKADREMYSANADYTQARQDALAATNLSSNMNRSSASNFGAFQGRQSMNFANLSRQLGNISMQENNQRSQQAVQRGQYEATKSVDKANRLYQNRVDNQMNQANADYADQKVFSELSQIGTTFNEYQYYKDALKNNKELTEMKIKESAAILGAKYENFGFDEAFMAKMAKGDYEDVDFNQLVKFIATGAQLKKAKDKGKE